MKKFLDQGLRLCPGHDTGEEFFLMGVWIPMIPEEKKPLEKAPLSRKFLNRFPYRRVTFTARQIVREKDSLDNTHDNLVKKTFLHKLEMLKRKIESYKKYYFMRKPCYLFEPKENKEKKQTKPLRNNKTTK
jgi:hypothetical protein